MCFGPMPPDASDFHGGIQAIGHIPSLTTTPRLDFRALGENDQRNQVEVVADRPAFP